VPRLASRAARSAASISGSDGKPLPLTEVNVPQLNIQLPDDNVFDVLNGVDAPDTPRGPGLSAAHGWVALLNPLPPGEHKIVINDPIYGTVTTTIIVTKAT